jgi:hypothetical protein
MDTLPVSFSTEHKGMLVHAKLMLDREVLAFAPVFSKLIVALGTRYARDGDLKKQVTSHDDLVDGLLRLSLKHFLILTERQKEEVAV